MLIFCLFSCFPAEILQANDKLSQALGQYRQVVASQENGGGGGSATSSADAPGKGHPAVFHNRSAPARHVWVEMEGKCFSETKSGEDPVTQENYYVTIVFFYIWLIENIPEVLHR